MHKKIRIIFSISFLVLIITFGLSLYSFNRLLTRADWVEHTNVILLKLEGIASILKDAETGQRGYLLTHNPEFLEPYIGSYYRVIQNYKEVRQLTRDNPSQQKRLDSLILLINSRFAHIESIIQLEKSGQSDSARLSIASGEGKVIMDKIRKVILNLENEEFRLKDERYNAVKRSSLVTPVLILLASFLSLLITVVAFIITRREIKKQYILHRTLQKTHVELEETNEEFVRAGEQLQELNANLELKVEERTKDLTESEKKYRFVIDFIPQIVWTCDDNGNIDFFNSNWFSYTGQTEKESLGWGWSNMLHPEDYEQTMKAWREAVNTGKEFTVEYRLKKSDGTYKWFLARAIRMKSDKFKWFGITTDVQDLKDAIDSLNLIQQKLTESNQELSDQNDKLQKINNDLDNFIYTASHDLKAPIANIEGLISILKKKECYNFDESKAIIDLITTSNQKLKHVIEDLAVIIRVQNEISIDQEDIDIDLAVEEVKFSITDLIASSGAEIMVECSDSPRINFSKRNFRSVIFNILSNAIKYKSPDRTPKIIIRTQEAHDFIILIVQDNGLGIDPEKISKIFSMFKRLHNHVEGSGIGLFIVKRIIDNAKGKIDVESEPGKGTTFKIYFPK